MPRPTGVTVLAVLNYISAACLLLGAIVLLLGGSMIGAYIGQASGKEGAAAGGLGLGMLIGGIGAVFCIAFCVLHAAIGWGLWTLKNWARILTIVLAAIGAMFLAIGILGSLMHFNILGLLWNMVWLGVYGAVIWYLLQPHVKMAFEQTVPPPAVNAAGM